MSRIVTAKPEHEVLYQELSSLIGRHKDKTPPEEILAIAANVVGKLIAMQDQRTMTRERAIAIVYHNIEIGNQEVLKQLLASKGST